MQLISSTDEQAGMCTYEYKVSALQSPVSVGSLQVMPLKYPSRKMRASMCEEYRKSDCLIIAKWLPGETIEGGVHTSAWAGVNALTTNKAAMIIAKNLRTIFPFCQGYSSQSIYLFVVPELSDAP
jgi:hypothetical protein